MIENFDKYKLGVTYKPFENLEELEPVDLTAALHQEKMIHRACQPYSFNGLVGNISLLSDPAGKNINYDWPMDNPFGFPMSIVATTSEGGVVLAAPLILRLEFSMNKVIDTLNLFGYQARISLEDSEYFLNCQGNEKLNTFYANHDQSIELLTRDQYMFDVERGYINVPLPEDIEQLRTIGLTFEKIPTYIYEYQPENLWRDTEDQRVNPPPRHHKTN